MVIGGKAEGLVRLQELGLPVPPFVAVPVGEEVDDAAVAALALAARNVPREVVDDLGDIEFGVFEGGALPDYRDWIAAHAPDDAPPAGESRVDTLRRFCRAYRSLLDRPEPHVLVVAHGLTLSALEDETPRPLVAGVEYGSWIRLTRDEVADRVARLERWCEAPAW